MMTLKWRDVIKKPEYQALSAQEKADAQEQYFNEVVAPQAGSNADEAKKQFYQQYPVGDQSQLFEMQKPDGDGKHANDGTFTAFMAGAILNMAEAGDKLRHLLHIGGGDDQQMAEASNIVDNLREQHKTAVSAGEFAGSAVPGLAGWGAGEALMPSIRALGGVGNFLTKTIAGSVGSQLASGDAPDAGQIALDTVISAMTHGVIHAGSAGISKIGKKAAESEIAAADKIAGAKGAEAERIMSQLSPEALGHALASSGVERDAAIKAIADRTGKGFDELKSAIEAVGGNSSERMSTLTKQGLRGDLDKLAREAKTNSDRIKIAEKLGLNTDILPPSFFSDNRQFIEFYQALKQMPGSVLSPIEEEALKQTSKLADDLIGKMGGTTDLSQLDQTIKSEVSNLIETMETQSNAIYENAFSNIPHNAEASAANALNVVKGKLARLGDEHGLLSQASRDIITYLSPKELAGGIKKNPTFGAIDTIRQNIGDAIQSKQGPYSKGNVGELRQLYGALTRDSEAELENMGLLDEVKKAKNLVEKRKALEAKSINLFGRDIANSVLPKLKEGVVSATKGDATKLNKVMGAIPESLRSQAAASALHYLFTGGSRGGDRALSIPGFVKGYEGLSRNSLAQKALFKHLTPEAKKMLSDFYTYAKGVNEAISSVPKTGVLGTLSQEFSAADTIAEKILTGDVSKKAVLLDKMLSHTPVVGGVYGAAKGITKAGLKESVGVAPEERLKKGMDLLASQEFQSAARKYAGRKVTSEMAIKQADEALKKSAKYKAWHSTLSSAEKAMIDRIGPYKTFAYWAALQYAKGGDNQNE